MKAKLLRVNDMRKFNVYTVLVITLFSMGAYAEEKKFLTVGELVKNGYILLSGQQILEIMANREITVVDIETDAVTISKKSHTDEIVNREFVETKSDKASSLLDARLMARAPALEGKVERKVVGDELISTDGVRTYNYKLYEKKGKIFAVRDIDHGDVFFEVKLE